MSMVGDVPPFFIRGVVPVMSFPMTGEMYLVYAVPSVIGPTEAATKLCQSVQVLG
jgi:hypothetical protein